MGLMKRATRWRSTRAGGLAAVLVSAVLMLCVTVLVGCGSDTTTKTEPQVTETTSSASTGGGGKLDFSGKTLDGTDVSLGGYRGKPLVLAFMASW